MTQTKPPDNLAFQQIGPEEKRSLTFEALKMLFLKGDKRGV